MEMEWRIGRWWLSFATSPLRPKITVRYTASLLYKEITGTSSAFILNGGAAGFMYLASKFQPSQLAEEQCTLSRFYKILARDIKTTLLILSSRIFYLST
jgi:hypothetical protein